MIPDDQVAEVKSRADIVGIIGEFVPLKRAGKEYKANCPFHEEKTPSFYVVPQKEMYHCFGCQASGDVFTFVQEKLGLDFTESVRWVADRAGVEVREVRRDREEEDPWRALYEANAFAASWFRERLLDPTEGADARAYLEKRGIDGETAERFGLGWAPDDWRGLRDAAAKHGIEDEVLLQVGLLTTSEKAPEPYDRFRGRLIFPIEALNGRMVAFGGRVLDPDAKGAKYLNTSETPIYHKGHVLYGLHRARHAIRRAEQALVVEGYMDVVSLAAAGFEHAVAPLGTAFTEEQARLLRRYTTHVLLLFDSDAAGLRATFKAGDILLSEGIEPAVVTLPEGEDPDTLVQARGAEALQEFLDQAVDVLDRKLQILEERDYFSSIERIRDAVDRLLPTLRAAADPALRDIYVAQVAARTGVRRETLEHELEEADARARAQPHERTRTPTRGSRRPEPASRPRMGPGHSLLQVIARDRERRHERIEAAVMHVGPGDFGPGHYRAIFQAFLDDPDLEAPPPDMDPEAAELMSSLLAEPGDEAELAHAGRVFQESLNALKRAALQRRAEDLARQIELTDDDDEKRSLAGEKARLARELREMGQDWAHAARRFRHERSEPPYP